VTRERKKKGKKKKERKVEKIHKKKIPRGQTRHRHREKIETKKKQPCSYHKISYAIATYPKETTPVRIFYAKSVEIRERNIKTKEKAKGRQGGVDDDSK